jgi:hypothetical protein
MADELYGRALGRALTEEERAAADAADLWRERAAYADTVASRMQSVAAGTGAVAALAGVVTPAGVPLAATAALTELASLATRLAAYGMRYYADHHLSMPLHTLPNAAARAVRQGAELASLVDGAKAFMRADRETLMALRLLCRLYEHMVEQLTGFSRLSAKEAHTHRDAYAMAIINSVREMTTIVAELTLREQLDMERSMASLAEQQRDMAESLAEQQRESIAARQRALREQLEAAAAAADADPASLPPSRSVSFALPSAGAAASADARAEADAAVGLVGSPRCGSRASSDPPALLAGGSGCGSGSGKVRPARRGSAKTASPRRGRGSSGLSLSAGSSASLSAGGSDSLSASSSLCPHHRYPLRSLRRRSGSGRSMSPQRRRM